MPLRWNATRLDQLESAVRRGKRVTLMRRGSEYVVTAVRLTTRGNRDALVGRHPMTGEELEFMLEELDAFEVVGD
ncbi:MAG TPA: hypothetical protein VLK88_09140 [Gemmatimonadales bacterium]|nr:hypothetical protein [Gemmatimonadales bacterium]